MYENLLKSFIYFRPLYINSNILKNEPHLYYENRFLREIWISFILEK